MLPLRHAAACRLGALGGLLVAGAPALGAPVFQTFIGDADAEEQFLAALSVHGTNVSKIDFETFPDGSPTAPGTVFVETITYELGLPASVTFSCGTEQGWLYTDQPELVVRGNFALRPDQGDDFAAAGFGEPVHAVGTWVTSAEEILDVNFRLADGRSIDLLDTSEPAVTFVGLIASEPLITSASFSHAFGIPCFDEFYIAVPEPAPGLACVLGGALLLRRGPRPRRAAFRPVAGPASRGR